VGGQPEVGPETGCGKLDDEGLNALSAKSKPYQTAAFSSTTGRHGQREQYFISFAANSPLAVGSNRTQVPTRNPSGGGLLQNSDPGLYKIRIPAREGG
jgi:hypothetical protein